MAEIFCPNCGINLGGESVFGEKVKPCAYCKSDPIGISLINYNSWLEDSEVD